MKTLKSGSTGSLVSLLKANLQTLGYALPAGDVFDNETERAVINFQTSSNIKVDGRVGKQTWTGIYLRTVPPRNTNSNTDRNNNLLLLHPEVREAAVATYYTLQSEGIPFRIFEAYRYPQRQAELYAQGRTTPGSIVTYAVPWSSYHQYGLAIDFVLFIDGQWSWANGTPEERKWWKRMHTIGQQERLMRLDFEAPHLQRSGTSSNALKAGVYPENGDNLWRDNLNNAIAGWPGDGPPPA